MLMNGNKFNFFSAFVVALVMVSIFNFNTLPVFAGTNIIANPSVETVSTSNSSLPQGWLKGGYGNNIRVLSYPVSGYDGAKALKAEITSYADGDAKWYFTPVSVIPGTTYTFIDYYQSNTQNYVTIQYGLADGTYKYSDLGILPAASAWNKFEKTFIIPSNYFSPVKTMTVFHAIKSVGYLSTDAFSLSDAATPPANLVVNPKLEAVSSSNPDMPYAWNKTTSTGIAATFSWGSTSYDGSNAVTVSASSYSSGAGAKWYPNSIPVSGGEEYLFSDYYMSTTDSYVTVQVRHTDGTYEYIDLMRLTPSSVWKKFEETFLIPPASSSIIILHGIKSVGSLSIDNLSLTKTDGGRFSRGMITFNFDDGLKSVYQNAMPIMEAHNLTSSHYFITGNFTFPAYMSATEMQSLNQKGNEIGSHSKSHPYLTNISDSTAKGEIEGSKSDLSTYGVTPNNFFVYPFGDFNSRTIELVKNAGYIGARTSNIGYNTKNSDKFALRSQHIESTTTFSQVKNYIDTAMREKTWLILEIHDVDNTGSRYSTTPALLNSISDYVVANNIPVVNTSEGIGLMN